MAKFAKHEALILAPLLLFVCAQTPAMEHATAIELRAERDMGGFVERQVLVFGEDRVRFSRNSNFMCFPAAKVALGRFAADYDDAKKSAREQLGRVLATFEPENPEPTRAEPASNASLQPAQPRLWGLRLTLGAREVAIDSSAGLLVKRLLEEACDETAWKPEKAARVSLDQAQLELEEADDKGVFKRGADVPVLKACLYKDGGVLDCVVKGYGRAFLQQQDDSGL